MQTTDFPVDNLSLLYSCEKHSNLTSVFGEVCIHTHTHMCVLSHFSLLCHSVDYSQLGYSPQDSPGKNNGVGFHALLQGIFSTQGSNPHLLRLLCCRQILYFIYMWVSLAPQTVKNPPAMQKTWV